MTDKSRVRCCCWCKYWEKTVATLVGVCYAFPKTFDRKGNALSCRFAEGVVRNQDMKSRTIRNGGST